jgi:hypothetical protein
MVGALSCAIVLLIKIYTMSQSTGKRAAGSPLSSEFDKKARLGLTDEEVNDLNQSVCDWIRAFPHDAISSAEDVSTRSLALTFQQVAFSVLDTARASTIDKSWLKVGRGEERINMLPREVQLDLASIWVEARDLGEWERFANHRALGSFNHLLRHKPQLRAALFQVETPSVEPVGARAYARLRDDQVAGAFIENQNILPAFSYFALQPPRNLGNTRSRATPRGASGSTSTPTTILLTTKFTLITLQLSNLRVWASQEP